MSEQESTGSRKIRRALLSVSDKRGLVELARELRAYGVELLSTGGTARALRDAGIEVRDVSEVTGFPEMLDGRVKTLHPRVHGALLGLRDDESHAGAMREHGIEPIDLAVINLYPFEQTTAQAGVTLAEAVEQIDIGGPAMIRSAAKNFRDVAVVVSPDDYPALTEELRRYDGSLTRGLRARLARRAFARTAQYDTTIAAYLEAQAREAEGSGSTAPDDSANGAKVDTPGGFPARLELRLDKVTDLRYGENPHQRAALYVTGSPGVAAADVLAGKEMSFNNYVDAEAAWQLVNELENTACAIIKHTNPAGAALGDSPVGAYRRALVTDPVSAFGGIVAFNCPVDVDAARALTEIFTEVIIAPAFDEDALEVLRAKKNLRVVRVNIEKASRAAAPDTPGYDYRPVSGGLLVQTRDDRRLARGEMRVVTRRAPTEEEIASLLFAWTVCKHTKSNAIVYARDDQTVGVGAGQMSRVDSVRLGASRAQLPVRGSVLASDAFFPFRDGLDEAARHGITAVIQPGGSVRDEEVIAAADEHELAMVFTGVRHFRH